MGLDTASREELLRLVTDQQAVIAQLEARLREVEAQLRDEPPRRRMPGHKPPRPPRTEAAPPRRRRAANHGRPRSAPTRQVVHAVERCPQCACALVGGSVKRTREVLELPLPPVEVVEHVYLERVCPRCRRRWTPPSRLGDQVVGQGRLGSGLLSLIVALREEGRLPLRTIQWYLATVHGLTLSVGAIVRATQQVAAAGATAVAAIQTQVRASPVVHGDETGWREAGRNGYVWSFSTPTAQAFSYGTRGGAMVDAALGPAFAGVLVHDGYVGYDHYPCPHQQCWVHLLRDLHELRVANPADSALAQWVAAIHRLYQAARASTAPDEGAGLRAKVGFEQRLHALVAPYLAEPTSPRHRLSARLERHLREWFTFVAYPEAPSDNNAAERSLRHLVVSRKISGGTRSALGTEVKMALATLFGTWRLQDLDPLAACRQLLTSPQV